MSYTLIGSIRSRAFRVAWMLEELGLDYEHVPAGPHSDEVRSQSPSGKIPVLLVDGAAMTDSTAILTFLADSHGKLTCPAGSPQRARQDGWTFRVLDEIDSLLWTAARHSFILPEDQRVPAVKDSLKAEFARNLTRLTDDMPGPFLMGDTMTVPDIILAHCGGWARVAGFPDGPDRFADYLRRLRARPAFSRAAELN